MGSEVSDSAPSPRIEVVIGCPGHQHTMTAINKRYVRWRCNQKRCRREGFKTFHIADSLTGRLVSTEYEQHQGRVIRPEGA